LTYINNRLDARQCPSPRNLIYCTTFDPTRHRPQAVAGHDPQQSIKEGEQAVADDEKKALEKIRGRVSPEVYSQVEAQIGRPGGEALMDNQNQNQGAQEALAKLKPDVLREVIFPLGGGEEVEANQNQNQGKLDELLKLKPDVLRQVRAGLRGVSRGEEVMDNQNQNQGSTQEAAALKPPLSEPGKK
jgi:hypothetical protein